MKLLRNSLKCCKGNLRKAGSENIGATNALRVGGRLLGALTLMFDLLKGLLVIGLAIFPKTIYSGLWLYLYTWTHLSNLAEI